MKAVIGFILVMLPLWGYTGWSTELNLLSDYRFNGVSFNARSPALQGSVSYQHDSGAYVGTWASNADFGAGDPVKAEWDFFVGYYRDISPVLGVDLGYSMYTYHGDSGASDYNFAEYYLGVYFYTDTTLYWYHAPDYFNLNTAHNILKITHNIFLGEYVVTLSAANSRANDSSKWAWTANGGEYQYAEVAVARDVQGFNVRAAAMGTTIDDGLQKKNASPAVVISIGKGW